MKKKKEPSQVEENSAKKGKTFSPGSLYLVATPIGNLDDMTFRAAQTLREVDLIAAEDTRRALKLLRHFGIERPIISFYREKERTETEKILEMLNNGKKVALVSDAGMPGISDPGSFLVARIIEEGLSVIPIPGPSAVLLALTGSGLKTERFVFEGFLPRKGKERRRRLELLKSEERTIILFEAPHRLLSTLGELEKCLGGLRRIVLARELTKKYEEFWRGNLTEAVLEWSNREIRGEFTLVVEGNDQKRGLPDFEEKYRRLLPEITSLMDQGQGLSIVVREMAAREDLPRRGLYQWVLERIKKGEFL